MTNTYTEKYMDDAVYNFTENSRYAIIMMEALEVFKFGLQSIATMRVIRTKSDPVTEHTFSTLKDTAEMLETIVGLEDTLSETRDMIIFNVEAGLLEAESKGFKSVFERESYLVKMRESHERADIRIVNELLELREIFLSLYKEFLEADQIDYDLATLETGGNA